VTATPTAEQRTLAIEAAAACPFFAIEVWEAGARID
jgi:ferredoxin